MAKPFTLYWTSLQRYEDCPQKFLWYRGWGAIDCGGGPGKKKPKPHKDSRHHAVMGIVIQGVLEQMYNQEWWKTPAELVELMQDELDKQFKLELARNYIDWRVAGDDSIRDVQHLQGWCVRLPQDLQASQTGRAVC